MAGLFDDLVPGGGAPQTGGLFDDLIPAEAPKEGAFARARRIAGEEEGGILPAAGSLIAAALPEGGGKRGAAGAGGDLAVDITKGIVDVGQGAVGVANLASFGTLKPLLEKIGYSGEQTQQFLGGLYTEDRAAAERNVSEAKGFWDTLSALGTNPSALIGRVVESLPSSIGAGALAGAFVRRMLPAAAAAAGEAGLVGEGAAKFVADYIGKRAAGAAGAAEGALTAGQIAESGREAGQEFGTYAPAAVVGGAVTGVLGAAGGRVAQKLGVGDIEADIARRAAGQEIAGAAGAGGRLAAAAKGAVSEGVFEEAPQSLNEAIAANVATGQPWDKDLGKQTAEGLAAGATMGAGYAGTRSPHRIATPQERPDVQAQAETVLGAETIDDAIGAAMDLNSANTELEAALGGYLESAVPTLGPEAEVGAPGRQPPAAAGVTEQTRQEIDRQAELAAQAAAPGAPAFEREQALQQAAAARGAPEAGAAAGYADLTPMNPLQARQRLTVLRDQIASEGGDALGLTIVRHPQQTGALAIAQRQALPALELPAAPGVQPAEAQQRIESAALAGREVTRRAEDTGRQAVVTRAMQAIEQRGGVASPAEARIVQEAGLGKPYDRIDTSLAPPLREEEALTQATGIAVGRAPREEVRMAPRGSALRAPSLALHEGEVAVDPTTLKARGPSKAGAQGITRETHGLLEQVARAYGKRIQLYEGGTLDGFVSGAAPDTIHLNVASSIPHLVVFGHELLHTLKTSSPKIYAQLQTTIETQLKEGALEEFKKDYGQNADLEEVVGDIVGNRMPEETFWAGVFGEMDAPEVSRLGAAIIKAVNKAKKVVASITGFKTDALVKDLDAVKAAVQGAMRQFAKERRIPAMRMAAETMRATRGREENAAHQISNARGVQQEHREGNRGRPAEGPSGGNRVLGEARGAEAGRPAPGARAEEIQARENARREGEGVAFNEAEELAAAEKQLRASPERRREQTLEDFNREFGEDLGATFEMTDEGVRMNASGESAASLEAQSRLAQEKARGQVRLLVERDGTIRPLTGVDAVDTVARGGQLIVQRNVGRNAWTVLSEGPDATKSLRARALAVAAKYDIGERASTRRKLDVAGLARIEKNLTAAAERDALTRATAERLVEAFKALPPTDEFAAAAFAGRAKRGWYKESAEAIAQVFGPDGPRFAALLAAMSPQTSVQSNLRNALATWKTWIEDGRPQDREAIVDAMARSVEGEKGRESVLGAWVNNSVRALTSDDPTAAVLSGPKVDSFMRNLVGNVEEVTNDTWMANFALVDQTLFAGGKRLVSGETIRGKTAGYLAMNAKVRAAAARLTELTGETWTPAEVQETVWSWAKTLYEAQIEGRTARDILYDEELTDDMIRSTPDFKGLFHDERYEQILRDAGYGAQLDALRAGTAAEQKPAARGEAEPFASATQAKLLDRAAARLEELKTRGAAAPIRASTRRATQADFTPAELPRLLEKSDWAVLTAEDPGATKQSASANAAAMAELEDDLNAGGYDYESAVGKYGDTQNAFIVTGIDEDAARALGEKYGQESILTRDGLVYSDGRPNTPTTGEVTVYDKAPDDFYTSIPATNAFFQVGLDFEERASPARQTETPAFKRWFGDSKVVDAQGQPLVVYHGTSERFNAFSRAKLGSVSGSSDSKTGFWFTADYARGQDAARDARAVNEASEYWVLNVYLQIQRPLTVDEPLRSFDPADSAKLIRKAKREGHDGVIFNRGEGAGADYVVFRPEQIKSATGNSGVFDPTNPDIRASVQRAPAGWTVAAPGKMDDFIRTIQDKQIDTKRIVAAVRSKITDLSEKWDAYLQEELSHGRIAKRTKDFLDFELRPLLTEMQARGVTLADFETYLHNRHAEERNVQIAKVNPDMPDGGSGIKTAAARAYLAGLPAAQRTAYAALAKRADAVIGETEKMLVSSGLEKQETIDTWNKTYEHYAPLQREEFEEEGGQGTGQGMSVKGGASRRAMGSEKGVANILANIASARERTITRSEKNRVATAMYGLAITAPNKDFWMPFAPDRMKNEAKIQSELVNLGLAPPDAANVMAEPTQRYLDPRSGRVVSRPNPLLRSSPNVLALRVNGEDRFVVFSNSDERATRAVRAMKNLDADQLGRVLSASQMVSRWFASVSTQWNPVFGVVNLMRDTQEALFNLSTTPIADQKVKVLKNTGSALLGIYADIRAHRKGRAPQSPWAQLWEEFQKEGGQTGYRDMFANPKERSEALAKELNKITEGKAKQAGRAIFEWLSDYNEAMENAIRLSTYKAAKDKGLSNQQSASIAKNLTVNFNRKGEVALQAGSLYAFFNAAVQGSARLAETLRGPAGKKIVVGGLLLGVLQAFALSAGGFGDDEPPEFVRDKNLILPLGEGKFLSLPLPLGLFVLPAVGRRVTEWLASGGRDTGKRLTGLLGIFADAFNPIGNAGLSMQTLAPTALDPLAALAENRDFAGRPIAREDISGLKPTPGFTRTKDTASGVSKGLSYLLNRISGGTDYVPGAFSPTPDQIDYLIGQGTGGLGREVLKASTTARAAMTGEENPPHKVPLLGRFYGNATGQASEAAKFYGNVKRINEYAEEIAGRRKHGEGATVMAYIRDNPEARLAHLAETVQSDLQKAKSLKRKLMERDAPPETIKAVEARITQIMGRLNRRVEGLQN